LQSLPRSVITFKDAHNSQSQGTTEGVSINVRDAFVASKEHTLVAADYSQLEMRLMAHVAKDTTLQSFFNSGQDVHSLVASHWLGKDVKDVTSQERERAKRLVYGIAYGIGATALSEELKVSHNKAQEFMNKFLSSYPKVEEFIKNTKKEALDKKSIRTMTGRRRLLPKIDDIEESHKAKRQAVNSVIQGTAADVVKIAMIKIDEEIRHSSAKLLLQIHDELIYEVPDAELEKFISVIKTNMEGAVKLSVPLPTNLKVGKHWGSMTEVKALIASLPLSTVNNKLDKPEAIDEWSDGLNEEYNDLLQSLDQ